MADAVPYRTPVSRQFPGCKFRVTRSRGAGVNGANGAISPRRHGGHGVWWGRHERVAVPRSARLMDEEGPETSRTWPRAVCLRAFFVHQCRPEAGAPPPAIGAADQKLSVSSVPPW